MVSKSFVFDPAGKEVATQGTELKIDGAKIAMNGVNTIDLSPCFGFFLSLKQMLYIGPFRNAISIASTKADETNYYDISVGEAFIRTWQRFKTGKLIKENELIVQVTEDVKRVFEFDTLDINAAEDYSDFKIFIDGRSYTLLELGGGLAQFIVVLATVALQRPSFVLIDEPELNLHPRLQRDFLTAISSYSKQGVLFATHNIGLARVSAELIYSVRVEKNGIREVTPFETIATLSEFLGELSFSGYRELGFKKLLLVEGTTDVTTYQQLLRKYQKDHEIVLLPLGGGSLINATSEIALQEIKRITQDVYAIIDSERDRLNAPLNTGIQEFVNLCKDVGITCHVLERRAIENYFSERAIQIVKSSAYSALQPYERPKDVEYGWSKAENWRIAREMNRDELANTDLDQFLNKL